MNIRIDNYYINYNENNGIYSVCVEGQMIIHDSVIHNSKACAVMSIIQSIEDYNDRHNLKWNSLKEYPCENCNVGWTYINTKESKNCMETCEKLKNYLKN